MTTGNGRDALVTTAAELKREQIIDAARTVLARDGLAGCTARAVAEESPLTKSAIHYYFHDIDQIVDQAVAAHLDALLTALREVAARYDDPDERLHAVIEAYLDTFADKPYAAFLWFEHWIAAGRRGSTGAVQEMLEAVESLLGELIATGRRPRGLLSWLLGTVVQQHVRPVDRVALRAEVRAALSAFAG